MRSDAIGDAIVGKMAWEGVRNGVGEVCDDPSGRDVANSQRKLKARLS